MDYTDYIYHNYNYIEEIQYTQELDDMDDPILFEFPFFVVEMSGLRNLLINFHCLTEIPDEIGLLTELRVLSCSDNR